MTWLLWVQTGAMLVCTAAGWMLGYALRGWPTRAALWARRTWRYRMFRWRL